MQLKKIYLFAYISIVFRNKIKNPQRSRRVRMTFLGIAIMCDKKNIYWQITVFLIKGSSNFSIQIINTQVIPHNPLQDTEHPSLYIQKHSFLFRLSERYRGILLSMKFCKSAVLHYKLQKQRFQHRSSTNPAQYDIP